MLKKLIIPLLISLVILSFAGSNLLATNRHQLKAINDNQTDLELIDNEGDRTQSSDASALGVFATDGGSPGVVIGRSWKDDQNHLNPGRMIDWRVNPQLHFIYNAQVCAGLYNPNVCARWIHYNMFDPTTPPGGVFLNGTNGIPMQMSPFVEGGMYPNLAVDENGRMIAVAEGLNSTAASGAIRWVKLWWDISDPSWGTFVNDSIPDQNTGSGLAINRHYPIVEYQEFGGQYITHLVALNGIDPFDDADKLVSYWRKVTTASGLGGTWTSIQIADGPWSDTYDMAVSPDGTGKVAIAWCQERDESSVIGSAIWMISSTDAGASWSSPVDVVPFEAGTPSFQAWNECSLLYDSDGYLHIVYNTTWYDGTTAGDIDPSRIYHWTDRVAGSDAGGLTSLIQAFDFDGLETMCGQFGHNLLNVGMPVISECNGRLYTIWMQAGDPERGDSTDCVAEDPGPAFLGAYNGDIHMSTSLSLDGSLWDARRNLTDSKTPGCDGTDGNPCDHDAWATMSRYGMDTRVSAIGATYWSSIPELFEVRDALDASYPDTGFYLDVQYIDDLLPESAMFLGNDFWTNNPIKWFRLPCLDPIIKPKPYYPQGPFIHPSYWIKSGSEVALDYRIANIGNDDLHVTSISANIIQGTGWLTINTTTLVIPPAGEDYASFTINPGGAIAPPAGQAEAIEAWIYIDTDYPDSPRDSFYIKTVITDSVVAVTHAVVETGLGLQLGVLNNGSAANFPNTGGYLAFENDSTDTHLDCDSQEVYLYEVSPIIMYDQTTYFWNGYYDANDPDPNVNLLPVVNPDLETESCLAGGMSQYVTGEFVTADSAIGMTKVWSAPLTDVSYVIEQWKVYSYDGATHTGVQLAEWADCDVPSDTNVNNNGTIVQADDYVYVSGQETDGDQFCVQNDSRFYMHGLLGYYTTSEFEIDNNVNQTGLAGAYVTLVPDLMSESYEFIPDSVWSHLTRDEFTANNSSWDDQRTLLSFGSFDLVPDDTLVLWIVHGSLINATPADVATQNAEAKIWYLASRADFGECSCCGKYTGGIKGNVDYSPDGKVNLADITVLIDHIYISKAELLCWTNADLNGDGKVNLADITLLIDCIYISKFCEFYCP